MHDRKNIYRNAAVSDKRIAFSWQEVELYNLQPYTPCTSSLPWCRYQTGRATKAKLN